MEPFIRQHQAFLLRKSGNKILTLLAIIFLLYICLKINSVAQNIDKLQSVQIQYLSHKGIQKQNQQLKQHGMEILMLNFARQIFSLQITDPINLTTPCTSEFYLCDYTDLSLMRKLHYFTPLIINSYSYFSGDEQKFLIVMQIQTKNKIVYNHPIHNLTQLTGQNWYKDLNEIVNYTITSFESQQNEINVDLQIENGGQYHYQCGISKLPIYLRICLVQKVIFPNIQNIDLTQNIKIRDYVMKYRTFQNQQFHQYSKWSLNDFIIGYASKMLITNNSKVTIQSDVLISYIQESIQTNPQIRLIQCYHSDFFKLFRTPIFISHFTIPYHQKYHTDLMYQVYTEVQTLQHFYIFSNKQYFQSRQKIVMDAIIQIQIAAQVLIVIAILWISILSYTKTYIQTIFYPTVKGATQFANIFISLCKQQDLGRVQWAKQMDLKKIFFLGSIIKYFKAFIWCKKVLKKNGNTNKRKNLLLDGLQFFNQSDFTPVLKFIYKELIVIQEGRIRKLKKLRHFTKIVQQEGSRPIKTQKLRKEGILVSNLFSLKEIDDDQKSQQKQMKKQDSQNSDFIEFDINRPETIFIAIQKRFKKNRGVRFSNEPQIRQLQKLQTERVKKKMTRKVRLSRVESKQLSNKFSQKSIQAQKKSQTQIQQSQKEDKSQKQKKQKRHQNALRSLLKSLQQNKTIDDLSGVKFDEFTQNTQYNSDEQSQLQTNLYSLKQIQNQISLSYNRIVNYLESLIIILKTKFQKAKNPLDFKNDINQIYEKQVQKLRFTFKFFKHKTKYDPQFDPQDQYVDYQYFNAYQDIYQIDQCLVQRALLYKMKIYRTLEIPFCYRQLQSLCNSQDLHIKMQAKHLFVSQFIKLQPHFDLQVIDRVCQNLLQTDTFSKYKRKQLRMLLDAISKNEQFKQQVIQIKQISRHYNYKNKKFYILADLSQVYDIFIPFIRKLYQLIQRLDLIRIYNLNYSDSQDIYGQDQQIMKPSKIQHFQALFQEISNQSQKLKSKTSTKTINKKLQCQKDFNNLLALIQNDQTQFSKYLIIILGGDIQNMNTSASEQADSSSYQNQRQIHQSLHIDILKRIQKNYFHTILVGQNLNTSNQTKQGRIKKYAKHSCDYLEIDLKNKNWITHYKQIQKFIIK